MIDFREREDEGCFRVGESRVGREDEVLVFLLVLLLIRFVFFDGRDLGSFGSTSY